MRGKANAIKQAKKLITTLDITAGPKIKIRQGNCATDLVKLANNLGILVKDELLPDHISGFFMQKGNLRVVTVNEGHMETRRRFTIAHEIGHYVLHANQTLHLDKDIDDNNIFFRSDVSSLSEVEANHFAAEILMPEELVDTCFEENVTSVFRLAQLFNVSEDAMRYRLINLGYL